ncbi:hypothetical protein B0H14DRAFT_2609176 [Mycena olivaceomarginata]|nr:hypothetical protein B0H14DRAFT_2609176 [Mycena olivaceomarginata]
MVCLIFVKASDLPPAATSSTAALRQDHKGAVRYTSSEEEGPRDAMSIRRPHPSSPNNERRSRPGDQEDCYAAHGDRRTRIRRRYEETKVHPALSALVTRISCSIRCCAERHGPSSSRARAESTNATTSTPCEAHDVADRCVPWIQTNEVGSGGGDGSVVIDSWGRRERRVWGIRMGCARVAEAGDRVRRPARACGSAPGTVRVPRLLMVLGDDAVDARSSSAAYGRAVRQWRVYATRWQIYWWATEGGEIRMRCHSLHRGVCRRQMISR